MRLGSGQTLILLQKLLYFFSNNSKMLLEIEEKTKINLLNKKSKIEQSLYLTFGCYEPTLVLGKDQFIGSIAPVRFVAFCNITSIVR